MNKLRLYIENQEVELQEEIQIDITKQFEELSNPTIICNDYTKTVQIPMSARNNEIFGHIYCPDRLTAYSNTTGFSMGIYFDPMKKLDFRLEWNGDLLMQGYAKTLSVVRQHGFGYYEITLNGEVGKIFQELKKITFDPSISAEDSSMTKYYIDLDKMYPTHNPLRNLRISKELVYSGWTTTQHIASMDSQSCTVTDVINFAPCNAFDEDFDYNTYQISQDYTYLNQGSARTFDDTLDGEAHPFSADTGVEASTVIPDGMTPRGIGEYRSYLQQPFIYWNKLWQIFRKKGEEVTGYKFSLDSSWFNTNNDMWYKLVYMLKKLNAKTEMPTETINSQSTLTYNRVQVVPVEYRYEPTTDTPATCRVGLASQNEIYNPNTGYFTLPADENFFIEGEVIQTWLMETHDGVLYPNHDNTYVEIEEHCILVHEFIFYDQYGNELIRRKYGCRKKGSGAYVTGITTLYDYDKIYPVALDEWEIHMPFRFDTSQQQIGTNKFRIEMQSYVAYTVQSQFLPQEPPFRFIAYGEEETTGTMEVEWYKQTNTFGLYSFRARSTRSYSRFTLNDLWNNEYNLFEQILNYCKMFRIFIIADNINKELKFITSTNYFSNYQIKDWTEKICTDMDVVIKPITWENKYVLFNYKDSETDLGMEYMEKYTADWGEKRVVTEYNFNTETKELFNDISPSLVNTDNVLSWGNLYDNHKIVYTFPAETSVCMKDDEGFYVDQFGSFYVMKALGTFDTTTGLRTVHLSDDTDYQVFNNTYFYSQSVNSIQVDTYPKLDVLDYNNRMCVFGVPMENYTYQFTAYTNASAIYDYIWKKYIDERYNKNNKIVTCYVYMSPSDFIDFEFNHFIKIENQLYMVNEIYDFNASATNQKVKVDLITIQSIEGYTTR